MTDTRKFLALLKSMGWLKAPFSDMDIDRLEHLFKEDKYLLENTEYEVIK